MTRSARVPCLIRDHGWVAGLKAGEGASRGEAHSWQIDSRQGQEVEQMDSRHARRAQTARGPKQWQVNGKPLANQWQISGKTMANWLSLRFRVYGV